MQLDGRRARPGNGTLGRLVFERIYSGFGTAVLAFETYSIISRIW